MIVYDSIGEYEGCIIKDSEALADYLNARGEGAFRVSYRDPGLDGLSISEKFKMLQDLRSCWVGFEEASKWVGPTTADPQALWFVQYGRHNGLSSVWVARRPAELHRHVTAQADVVLSFQQSEPRDLQYIREIGGPGADDRIAALGPHEWDYVIAEHEETVATLEELSDAVGRDSGTSADVAGAGSRRDFHEHHEEPETSGEGARAGAEGSGPARLPANDEPGPAVKKPGLDSRNADKARVSGRAGAPGSGRRKAKANA